MSDQSSFNVIQQRLQDSGHWDKIYANLNEQLNEAGWVDELYNSAKERSRGESIPIHQLMAELGPTSTGVIPAEVKARVVAMIHAAIENMVEK
ncbi:hypothetical protein M408DRAFT_328383 [Serendipita vermifera MAFF 305830]|uniref:Transcription and mRNA export factor SUS1 n=1 Tax=Serendipita vermifera MAFF 305830 TaxID=933852 RepID=A0A0C2XLM9_SERVB|nr:hypothetical protein M408DRAFT_328383 [Serendipita vermifera MAFF 305830]